MANIQPDRILQEIRETSGEFHLIDKNEEEKLKSYLVKENRENGKNEYEISVDKHNKIKITEERLQELGVSLATFFKHALSSIENTEEQLKIVRENGSDGDYAVPTTITEESQHAFAKKILGIQSKFKTYKQEKENNKSFENWKNSFPTRNRLVIVDPKNISPKELAERILGTSAIERLLIINHQEIDQEELKKELKIKLLKYTKQKDIDAIAGIEGEEAYVDMEEPSISHLIGPHLIQDDSILDKDRLEDRFPQLFSPINGVILHSDDEQAAKDLLILSESFDKDKDIEPVRFKTSPFEPGVTSNFTFAGRTSGSVLKLITSGLSSEEMLDAKSEDGQQQELTLNPKYESLLSESNIKNELKSQGVDSETHITEYDIKRIEKFLIDKFLYDPHISPDSINPIISGATSMIQIQKSNAVYKELYKIIKQQYTSSAVELTYAVTGMTRDGGSDQVQEGLAESLRYKSFFYSILGELQKQGIKEDEAILIAFAQTLDAHVGIEKLNKSIYDLERGPTGAQAYRNYSIEHVNKVVKSNKKGLKILDYAPTVFWGSCVLLAVGIVTLIPAVAATVGVGLLIFGSSSLGLDVLSRAMSGISMYFQKKANKKDLTKSTIASAEANLKKNQAKSKRKTLLAERKKELCEKIKLLDPKNIQYKTLGKIKTTSDKPLEYFFLKEETKEVTKRWPFSSFGYKRLTTVEVPNEEREKHICKDSRAEIEEKIDIIVKHDIGTKGKLPKKTKITQESIREYTKILFTSMAKRSNKSTEEEHKKYYEKFIHSAEYRSRLVIIETPEEDEDIKLLANNIYKSSPENRLLLIGLNGNKKDMLLDEMRDLLVSERLIKCKDYKDLDGNIFNDRKYIAHEIASILQRENKLDEIIKFNKDQFGNEEGYNEEDPDTIINDFVNLCDDPKNLDSLKKLIPEELLIKPHLYQEDNDINKKTLQERYPHFEENIEDMVVLCHNKDVAKTAFETSVEIKENPIPVLIIKSREFEEDDIGDFHCACKGHEGYKAVLEAIAFGNTTAEIIGLEKAEANVNQSFSRLSQNGIATNSEYKHVTVSAVFNNLFNLNIIKNKLSQNKDKVCEEDVNYMRTILLDETLYEAGMSPEKSTQTISKSDSKLAALAGEIISDSLDFNIIGLPKSVIQEVKYAIAFMALDTGVDFEDEILKNKDLYRLIFQKSKKSYLEENIDSATATEKAYIKTLNFFVAIKNNPKIKEEKLKGEISRELAYMKVNEAVDLAKETGKNFKLLPYMSVLGLGMGILSVIALSVATAGFGLIIPAAIGVGLSLAGLTFSLARVGMLYIGLRKNRRTNKQLIPRSNFFSKDATFKIGDVFKNVKLMKDKLLDEKVNKTKEEILSVANSKERVKKNSFFKKIDDLLFTEMVVMKKEMKNIIHELNSDKKNDKSQILSTILRKIISNNDWKKISPLELIKKEIYKSKLESGDKRRFIAILTEVKNNSIQIDNLVRKMQRRISI